MPGRLQRLFAGRPHHFLGLRHRFLGECVKLLSGGSSRPTADAATSPHHYGSRRDDRGAIRQIIDSRTICQAITQQRGNRQA